MNVYGLLVYGIVGLAVMIIKIIASLLTSIYIVRYCGLTSIYSYGAVIVVWMLINRLIISDKFSNHYNELIDEYNVENEESL